MDCDGDSWVPLTYRFMLSGFKEDVGVVGIENGVALVSMPAVPQYQYGCEESIEHRVGQHESELTERDRRGCHQDYESDDAVRVMSSHPRNLQCMPVSAMRRPSPYHSFG